MGLELDKHKPSLLITPDSANLLDSLYEVWRYRELVWVFMMRDIKVRYKQTVLGVAWAVLQPLTMMAIFSIIFGMLAKIPSDGVPYPVFVFSGMLAWNFFSSAVAAGGNSLVGSAGMLSKVYFPRICIPLASVGTAAVDFLISFVLLLILVGLSSSVSVSGALFFVPLLFLGLLCLSLAVVFWLSAVTVTYRDFRFVVPFALQIMMYVTAVIYPVSFIPEGWRWLMYLNPVNGWVSGIRSAVLQTPFDGWAIVISLLFSIALLILGFRYFQTVDRRFADVV